MSIEDNFKEQLDRLKNTAAAIDEVDKKLGQYKIRE